MTAKEIIEYLQKFIEDNPHCEDADVYIVDPTNTAQELTMDTIVGHVHSQDRFLSEDRIHIEDSILYNDMNEPMPDDSVMVIGIEIDYF